MRWRLIIAFIVVALLSAVAASWFHTLIAAYLPILYPATIAEMAYPVAATLIASAPAPWGFGQPLYGVQIAGTVLLLIVIAVLGWTKEKVPPVVQATAEPASLQLAS